MAAAHTITKYKSSSPYTKDLQLPTGRPLHLSCHFINLVSTFFINKYFVKWSGWKLDKNIGTLSSINDLFQANIYFAHKHRNKATTSSYFKTTHN